MLLLMTSWICFCKRRHVLKKNTLTSPPLFQNPTVPQSWLPIVACPALLQWRLLFLLPHIIGIKILGASFNANYVPNLAMKQLTVGIVQTKLLSVSTPSSQTIDQLCCIQHPIHYCWSVLVFRLRHHRSCFSGSKSSYCCRKLSRLG